MFNCKTESKHPIFTKGITILKYQNNMRSLLYCFLLLFFFKGFSQENTIVQNASEVKIDSLYREDQFYFAFTFNTLQDKPVGLSQSKFSTGFTGGFLRDMPINKKRTIAIASGIGLTYNNYNQNLSISESNQTPVYSIIDSKIFFEKNKFAQLSVDIPIEFRWRTSTYESYKFWRVYAGLKMSYLVYDKSTFIEGQEKTVISGNKDFNKFIYGAYISTGYNSVNVYACYSLNPLFKSAKINNDAINMKSLNVGVIFYFL